MPEVLTERLLTIRDVAELLGVTVDTLYQWRYRHEGPTGYRIGGRIRYRRGEVEEWISEQADPRGVA
jgi:excisionase family DNA binding protein